MTQYRPGGQANESNTKPPMADRKMIRDISDAITMVMRSKNVRRSSGFNGGI
jgi:hypothetical protein